MYMVSYSIEVNPAGVEPVLTAQQVWAGLVMKAENALPFVPVMQRCDVIERSGNTLLREITLGGEDMKEFITLLEPIQVQFERVGTKDFIQNTISESERGLMLTFTVGVSFAGAEPGSEQERQAGDAMRHAYVNAVGSTLRRVREMVMAGEL
ncbi:hypothetical protein ASE00_00700 [Sphingomonas sp. Root710]|uniref:SRPBCC family protein n=1 Tax=Sphingomonas sp. Root710 TaxID=1736594 RepID=UPI0006F38C8C|nr:SRPBCC family protein [Sphingomonas sp. Root710]KRB85360.1 hypothetical protein ASE00_00700 [Sphingomonas sp. Root710]